MNDSIITQPAFTQEGRKGVAYDWQRLCDAENLAILQELDDSLNDQYLHDGFELATTRAE